MTDFLTNLSPSLRQSILDRVKRLNEGTDDLTEQEIERIAEQVAKSEVKNTEDGKKLNLDSVLSDLENGIYEDKLEGCAASKECAKGFDGKTPTVSKSMGDILVKYGICKRNEKGEIYIDQAGNPKIFDYSMASKLVGQEVHSWDEFYDAFTNNSYSYKKGEANVPNYMKKYLVGPTIEYGLDENGKKTATDNFYALNFIEIEKDFPGQNIKTMDDLKKAVEASTSHNVNGKIDEWVNQSGETGDCWLLSGVLALSSTEAGAKAIKEAIHPQSDGSVIVEFKGAYDTSGNPVKIRVSAEEIKYFDTDTVSNDRFSNGDNDMLVLELAVNKLEAMISIGEAVLPTQNSTYTTMPSFKAYKDGYTSFIEGSFANRLITMLTGVDSEQYWDDLTRNNIYKLLSNAAENPGTVMSFGLYIGDHSAKQMSGETFTFNLTSGGHAFAITDVKEVKDTNGKINYDESTITFVNPWNSQEKITVSWKEFVNLDIGQMSSTSLNGVSSGTTQKPDKNQIYADFNEDGNNDIAFTYDEKFTLDLINFIKGNMTVEQLSAILEDKYDIKLTSVEEKGGNIIVKLTDEVGEDITLICKASAVKDGVLGEDLEELKLFESSDGVTVDGVSFSEEEMSKYFISTLTVSVDGQSFDAGYYAPSENWPEGVNTPAELRAYLDKGSDKSGDVTSKFGNLQTDKPYSSYSDFLANLEKAVGKDNIGKVSIKYDDKQSNDGTYSLEITYKDGNNTETVSVKIEKNNANEVALIKGGVIDSPFKSLLNVVEDKYALEVYLAIKDAKAGDVNALLDLEYNGFDLHNAKQKPDGSFDVKISKDGVIYTFNFPASKKADLIALDLLKDKSKGNDNRNTIDSSMQPDNAQPGQKNKFQFIQRYE